jgi:hypothetical protein
MFRFFYLLFFVAVAASAADNDADILKNVDIFQMEVVSDPQISPDGSTVAYVRRAMDIMSDRPVVPTAVPAGHRTAIASLIPVTLTDVERRFMCAGWTLAKRPS